jgi:hypothetical protein
MASSPSLEADNRKRTRRGGVPGDMKVPKPDSAQAPTVLVSQHVSPTADDAPDGEAHSSGDNPRLRLLDFPFEILSHITMELCGSRAMTNLSLVNKKIHEVAEKAMAKRLLIHPGQIKAVIEWLTRHPELMSGVNTVDLGAYQPGDTEHAIFSDDTFKPEVVDILLDLIPRNSGGTTTWESLGKSQPKPNDLWSADRRFFLGILFSLCPNISNVTIQMPQAQRMTGTPHQFFPNFAQPNRPLKNTLCRPVSLFPGPILEMMQNSITSITVAPGHKWTGLAQKDILRNHLEVMFPANGKRLLTFAGFRKLKHLDIPMDVLGHPQTVFFHHADDELITSIDLPAQSVTKGPWTHTLRQVPTKILPLSLRTLRLRSCDHRASMLLQRVTGIPAHKSHFTLIELYFDTCARSSLITCLRSHQQASEFLTILSQIESMGTAVTFRTGKHDHLIDIRAEVTRMQYLSDCDMSVLSSVQKQFSSLNLDAVQRRSKSYLERHLFHKHGLTHFDLLNSPTFDARVWRNAAFFHGVENTRFDPEFLAEERPAQKANRGKAKRRRVRRLPGLDDFVFDFATGPTLSREQLEQLNVVFLGETITIDCSILDWKKGNDEASAQSEAICILRTYPIYFKCSDGEPVAYKDGFEAEVWCKVEWKYYLQAHVAT